MKQLLSIKRIPMDIEINVTPWKFERDREAAKAAARDVRSPASAPIHSPVTPTTTGGHSPLPVINDFSDKDYFEFGGNLPSGAPFGYYQPTGTSVGSDGGVQANFEEDDLVAAIRNNPIRAQMASRPIESLTAQVAGRASGHKNVINWSNNKQNVDFEATSGGDYTAVASKPEWKFVPSSVEVVVNQLPGLEIEYIGSPLYFPRSADPNYVPPEGV
jgi:hypothetical protein